MKVVLSATGETDAESSDITFTTPSSRNYNVSIADARSKANGDSIIIEGWLTVKEEFDNDKGTFFMQDETAGIAIYFNSEIAEFTANAKPGMKIKLYGVRGEYRSLVQINPTAFEITDNSINMPAAKVITISQMDSHQGQLVTIENISGNGSSDTEWGRNKNYTITVGSETTTMRIDGDTDIDGTAVGTFPKNITGLVGAFNTSQLLPRSVNDIKN